MSLHNHGRHPAQTCAETSANRRSRRATHKSTSNSCFGTRAVGIGESHELKEAELVLASLDEIGIDDIIQKLPKSV